MAAPRVPRASPSSPGRSAGASTPSLQRYEGMLSASTAMLEMFRSCEAAAKSDATALIVGETGTGKELVARALHRRSGRRGRFVAVNAGGVSPNLIESELFGHERGAFTGADRPKRGAVQHANGGTLFLDEVVDLPLSGQVSLLRFLQESKVRPVGAVEEQTVDVRVVVATNVSLLDAVAKGAFRQDLYYRLDVVRIEVPALRDRPEDLEPLFAMFVRRYAQRYGRERPSLAASFLTEMRTYSWPGNVRQLENMAERLVLSNKKRPLGGTDFKRAVEGVRRIRPTPRAADSSSGQEPELAPVQKKEPRPALSVERASPRPPLVRAVEIDLEQALGVNLDRATRQIEKAYLEAMLSKTHGRVGDAAKLSGISRRTMLRKLNELEIDKNEFKLDS